MKLYTFYRNSVKRLGLFFRFISVKTMRKYKTAPFAGWAKRAVRLAGKPDGVCAKDLPTGDFCGIFCGEGLFGIDILYRAGVGGQGFANAFTLGILLGE